MVDVAKLRKQLPQNWTATPIMVAMETQYAELKSLIEKEIKIKQRINRWLAQPLVEDTMGILSEALSGECLFSRKPSAEEFQLVKGILESRLSETSSAISELKIRLVGMPVDSLLTLGLTKNSTLAQVTTAYTVASSELTRYLDKNCLTPLASLEADGKTGTPEWVVHKTEELWTNIKLARLSAAYRVLSS